MTFVYCKFFTYADAYNTNLTTDTWAQIPLCIKYRNKCDFDDANKVRTTISWHEYVGTSSNTELHTYVSNWAITTGQQDFTTEEYVPESEFTNPNRVVTNTAKIRFEWMRNSTVLSSDEINFNIYGKAGGVSWAYPMPQPYQSTYPLIGDLFSIGSIMTDYSSTSSGAPIVWREPYNGIAKDGWACGLIYSYSRSRYYTFDEAISAGIIKSASCDSYVNDDRSGSKRINGIFIAILTGYEGFVLPGRYQVGIRYYDQSRSASQGSYTERTIMGNTFTVYEPFAGAALEISAVYPAKYAYGSSDPLRGIPPYTVYVYDGTYPHRNTYTIPVTSITIDWGDPASAGNITTITYPGTSYISIPPHTYTDTNSHTITMTCVDALGNTTTATVQFTPSKDPRVISQPTVSYDGSTAPVLVTGTAEVAGTPLPDVTWRYVLRNTTYPEYYTGTKIGEYTEFSLLAGGTYDITCTVMAGTATLGTWSWVKTISSPTVYSDTPVAANDFDIWVYQNGQRVDVIKPTRCQYVDRLAHSSYCEFDVPMNYQNMSLLLPGAEIAIGYLGKARYMMVTEFSEDSLGEVCSITAMDAATVALQNRIATIATRSLSDGGYDVQTCSAEALMRYFALSNIRSGNRVIPRFRVVDANQDRGGKITYSARYETILTVMEEICTQSGLGWDSSLQSDSSVIFSFKVIAGLDRTVSQTSRPWVVFTERENGLRSAKLSSYHGILGSNLVIAAGKGEGDTRLRYQDYGATSATDLQRREVFVDAGDSATDYEVQCAAETELARQDEQTITVYPTDVYKFGVDYNLGDYVTVITKSGIQKNLQIIQANLSLDETGVNLSLDCGTDLRSYQRLIQRNKFENTYARK